MQATSQRPKGRDDVLSTLRATIKALDLAREICSVTPAKATFGSAVALLTMIRVRSSYPSAVVPPFTFLQGSMTDKQDCVDIGLSCADVCKSLDWGLKGKRADELSQSLLEAIQQLNK